MDIIKLRELRMKKGFKQKDVAEKLGLNAKSYNCYEMGTREPDHATLVQISNFFNVSVDYLLGREMKQAKLSGEPLSFERFSEMLYEKGLTETDIENLTKEQLSTIADIVKNFKP